MTAKAGMFTEYRPTALLMLNQHCQNTNIRTKAHAQYKYIGQINRAAKSDISDMAAVF